MRKTIFILGLLLLIAFPSFATDYCSHANVEGAWLMEANEDPIQDCSSNGIDLTAVATVGFGTSAPPSGGFSTGYYRYDGIAGAHESSSTGDIDLTGDFTIVAWVWADDVADTKHIVGKRNGGTYQYQFRLANNTPSLLTTSGSVNSTGTVTANSWNHLAVVYDADGNTTFYINGVSSGTPTSVGISSQAVIFTVGNQSGTGNPFDGGLDEVGIFSTLFNSTQINDIKDNGLYEAADTTEVMMITKRRDKFFKK